MADRYELWADGETGAVYAVRLEGEQITGYRGPLSLAEMALGDLAGHAYALSSDERLDTMRCGGGQPDGSLITGRP